MAALEARSEGWIAGLQLAALSLQDGDRESEVRTALQAVDRYAFDYLAEEVLARQPDEVRSFLLETSILDRFNAELAAHLTGSGDARAMLDRLDRANLFLLPLDPERHWYRYHALFGDFLRARLHGMRPEWSQRLSVRASEWFEAQGFTDEAVKYVLAGGEIERAVALVEAHSGSLIWRRDDRPTVHRWLEALPEEVIRARPRLSLDQAWLALGSGLSERRLEDAERLLAGRDDLEATSMRGEIADLRGEIAVNRGEVDEALAHFRTALEILPDDAELLRGTVMQARGYTLRVAGKVREAESALREAERLCNSAGNVPGVLSALGDLGEVLKLQGRLHEARRTFERALEAAGEGRDRPALTVCAALVGLGDVLREQGDLDRASSRVDEGLELANLVGFYPVRLYGYLVQARIRVAAGDPQGAAAPMQLVLDLASRETNPRRAAQLAADAALLQLRLGETAAALCWAEAQPGVPAAAERDRRESECITLARSLLIQGRPAQALELLDAQRDLAEAAGRDGRVIEMRILTALAFQAMGEAKRAREALRAALERAEPEGYVRVFLDEGEPLLALLRGALADGVTPDYVSRLLKASVRTEAAPSSDSILTARELEVLELIAEGLSNQAIAERLIRSVGTVKAHTSSIYGKLGVGNRTEAVARARALGLLD